MLSSARRFAPVGLGLAAGASVWAGALAEAEGLDCKHAACKGRVDMMQKAFRGVRDQTKAAVPQPQPSARPVLACPVNKDDLGEGTWALLHTMAAHFPDAPTEEDERSAQQFYTALARFYPCPVCAADFQQSVQARPPATQSREALVLWTCRLHNEVNAKLGRPVFACQMEELDRRWLEGGEACQDNHDDDDDDQASRDAAIMVPDDGAQERP